MTRISSSFDPIIDLVDLDPTSDSDVMTFKPKNVKRAKLLRTANKKFKPSLMSFQSNFDISDQFNNEL